MNLTPNNSSACIDVCNSLLRGEISAIETYAQAIDKFQGASELPILEKIRDEHVQSANRLRENVKAMGGEADQKSGAWGLFAKAVQGAAILMGENSAQKALLEGEEHGLKEYQEALDNEHVMPECKSMIRNELLPKIEQHIATLKMTSDRS